MSSVNKTENYGLSQFSANDKPTWMGDYSGDMQKIDTALGNSAKRTSDKFSESLPYAAGAYCIKDDLLYKFKSAKSAGAWDASKVQATTVMSEITGLTEKIDVPSYAGITKLYDNTADVTDQTITIERDGWIQGISKTAATSGTPFLRLYINDVVVYEASGIEKNYIYVWSPLFAVKKGYRVKYTLKSETSDGNKQLRLYVK